MKMKGICKEISKSLGLTFLSTPLFYRWCFSHQRYEWYDPFENIGGIAPDMDTLKKSIRQRYRCSQCGGYHVSYVYNLDTRSLEHFYDWINSN
jgi:hypothetical protein